jgi:photosystem II stability/assembly factor-like uncharacterized protein
VVGDPLTYYMGTTGGGLWKTADAGQHWKNVSDGYFGTGSVGAVAVSKSHPRIVYVGMGEHAPRGVMTTHGDGVYRSDDGGKSWTHLGLPETHHISRIVIHPDDPDLVYVAAQGQLYGPNEERGVYRTTDGGRNWEKLLYVNDLTGASELSMDASNPKVLYAAMWHHQRLPWQVVSGGPGSGLYKSTDGGDNWTELTEGLPGEKGKLAIAVSPSNPEKVYALVESDSDAEKGGLFVSADAGASFNRVSNDHRLTQRAWYYLEVFADPNNEEVVYVLSAAALRSIDGGKTWNRIDGAHGDYHDLWINPANSRNLCMADDGGASISFDYGETWSKQDMMPTGQFYRISVDNQFPYRIYGGQQDNTSVSIASRSSSGLIGERDWEPSAGGESAFLAFDPDDPRYVMGGSYLGTIEVIDRRANAGTSIMSEPIQYLGRAASDMKYRFNWNAPIIRSRHEPDTYYHAAQKLLRTRDRGQTWEEVSPDLTRNQKDKQIKGGGPYTVEAVGAENYGTISYVTDSPHEAGVIWVGTDDGRVQLTRDNGDSWSDVSPSEMGETLVNAIEVSPHDPATAYIATTRYKFNDLTPRLYRTDDYGKSWTDITANLPHGAYTRVVREDTEREGLLFAGTERGVYVSFDDGGGWQAFNLNLPQTPITDLMVAHDDLIVATSGRAFWILDDLELVRQYSGKPEETRLYEPAPVVLTSGRSSLDANGEEVRATHADGGVNPAGGAVVYYYLPQDRDSSALTLLVTDAAGDTVRRMSSDAAAIEAYPGGPPPNAQVPNQAGLNRFVWDLRYPSLLGAPTAYIEGSFRGHRVSPGDYTIYLLLDGEEVERTSLLVRPNPTYDLSEADYADYHAFMRAGEARLNEMHRLVNELKAAREQLSDLREQLQEDGMTGLADQARELIEDMREWDDEMVQRKSKAYDDVENFPNRFTANYLFVLNHAESSLPRVNAGTRSRLAELNREWTELERRGSELLGTRVRALNEELMEAGIGAIWRGK